MFSLSSDKCDMLLPLNHLSLVCTGNASCRILLNELLLMLLLLLILISVLCLSLASCMSVKAYLLYAQANLFKASIEGLRLLPPPIPRPKRSAKQP